MLKIFKLWKRAVFHLKNKWRSLLNEYFIDKKGILEITTVMGCKINCRYCPQEKLSSRYFKLSQPKTKEMDFELFKSCLDKVPPEVRIDFSGMAEPWLNKKCTDMVEYAAHKGHPLSVYTTLVGMTKQDFERIKNFYYVIFVIHLPDQEGNSKIPITDEWLDLLNTILCAAPPKLKKVLNFSCHGKITAEITNKVPLLSRFLIDSSLYDEMMSRAGNLEKRFKPISHKGAISCGACGRLINRNELLPDGTVLLCCMDYGMAHVLGNLSQIDYYELFCGEEARKVLQAFDDENLPSLCRRCEWAKKIRSGERARAEDGK